MYKKSLLSVAVASVLTLTGCLENNKIENRNNAATTPENDSIVDVSGTYPLFEPAASVVPIPSDLIFDADAGDGTFAVTPDPANPAVTALQSLSGASPIAPIDIAISGKIDPSTLAGNVHLIKLEYASGDPVRGLTIPEPPTINPNPAEWPQVDVTEIELDGTSYIRINPITRLDTLSRYVVVVTNGVLDASGEPLRKSPGVSGYATLEDDSQNLVNPALSGVRSLINNLWEPIAVNYFGAIGSSATEDDIVLSYSFTTSDDEKVVEYIADPAQWFNDQLTRFIGLTAAKSVTGYVDDDEDYSPDGANHNPLLFGDISADGTTPGTDGQVDYLDVSFAVNASLAGFPPAPIEAALPTLFGSGAPCESTTGATAIACISNTLVAVPSGLGGFSDLLPTPTADATVSFDETTTLDINEISSLTANLGITAGDVSVTKGTITVPYYLANSGQGLVQANWVADDTLATAINGAFGALGLTLPQADPSVTQAVNYVFPFPKKQSDETIPVLAVHSSDLSSPDLVPVMYQHGIGTDRSTALAYGGSLVAGARDSGVDVAVIAIDQPLHGIDGISAAEQAALAEQLLAAGGSISPDGVFDGSDSDAADQAAIDAAVAGTLFIGVLQSAQGDGCAALAGLDLSGASPADIGTAVGEVSAGNCGATAQARLAGAQTLQRTVANGASTIAGLGMGSDDERHFGFTLQQPGVVTAMDYTGSGATNASGSMFINLTSFLTGRDNLRQLVTDLLTVRKSLGLMDFDNDGTPDVNDTNAYFVGHSLGTINGIPFVVAANGSATADDDITATLLQTPGGGVVRLIENSVNRSGAILTGLAGLGLTQDTASFQAFLNILQASLDAGDAINFVDRFAAGDLNTPVLFAEVLNDQTIPNSIEPGEQLGDGSVSYLSGTEPLFAESGATKVTTTGGLPLGQNFVQFTDASSTHGTPAYPSTGTAAEVAAFTEMVTHGVSIVVSGGTAVQVANTGSTLDLTP